MISVAEFIFKKKRPHSPRVRWIILEKVKVLIILILPRGDKFLVHLCCRICIFL